VQDKLKNLAKLLLEEVEKRVNPQTYEDAKESQDEAEKQEGAAWSSEEFCTWGSGLGFLSDDTIAKLRENKIDGACVGELTMDQLKDDLGISVLGHRIRFVKAIKDYNQGK
jgi:hypothetical protein